MDVQEGIGKERQSGTLGGQEGPTRKVTFEERCGAAEGVTIANTWENSIPGKANSPNKANGQVPFIFRCGLWSL